VLASVWFTRRRGLSFFRLADLAAPLIALGHFFGRLGCFAAGCCYGWPTRGATSLSFPQRSLAFQEMVLQGLIPAGATGTPPLHPTQLYEALAELVIFVVLLLVGRVRRYYGQVLVTYLILYPTVRFIVELYRADPGRRYPISLDTPGLNGLLGLPPSVPVMLSTSQLLSLIALALGIALALVLRPQRSPTTT
jgi:phosphatidylglycerol:prolipoprotein diacylglycerol transferase